MYLKNSDFASFIIVAIGPQGKLTAYRQQALEQLLEFATWLSYVLAM
jgi:hypothetical protein